VELSTYLIYFSISVVASASVGPSVLLAASNGINFGRKKALSGVLGHVSAILVLAIVSATGVGVLIMASETVFTVIKALGVAYLAYIGVMILRNKGSWALSAQHPDIPSGFSLYRKSFILGVSNPKALVFFTALFPQFINTKGALIPQFILLAGTSLVNAFCFTFAYALVGFHFKAKLVPAMNKGWLAKVTGSLFLTFASLLAVAK